jgi:hypothetical protein
MHAVYSSAFTAIEYTVGTVGTVETVGTVGTGHTLATSASFSKLTVAVNVTLPISESLVGAFEDVLDDRTIFFENFFLSPF